MRVVSMVPSWTETLIEAGVDVVGRTRFCIHPSDKVKSIPVVGGTKDINWEKLKSIEFDLLLLDKEENPKEMAIEAQCAFVATHIKCCDDVINELRSLSVILKNQNLDSFAERWKKVIQQLRSIRSTDRANNLVQLHELGDSQIKKFGIQSWIRMPERSYDQVVYLIWKNPYMTITQETFVGSMLDLVGLSTSISFKEAGKHYPEVNLSEFDKNKTLFLFSSEPYPFHKKSNELQELGVASAIVDGECYSWFGLRALKFLENQSK